MVQQKLIQAMVMASALAGPALGSGHDFGFPVPRFRKGNKYTPPKQDVPDWSSMTRQQRRHAERKAVKGKRP